MLNKNIMLLTIIFSCLFVISAVSAADNVTDVIVDNVDENEDVIDNDCSVELYDNNQKDTNEDENLLSSLNDDIISFEDDVDDLSASPPFYQYSVSVYDTTKYYGSSGSIFINVNPSSSSSYSFRYDFYLKVYDSSGNQKISKRYYGDNGGSETYNLGTTSLNPGIYTIQLVNYADSHVMSTAKLSVISVPYSKYSVKVSDVAINYGSSGTISMDISPASGYYYRYDFYLKVYDSKNKEIISKRYYSTTPYSKVTYSIGANDLDRGTYTIKILNNGDERVMATAKLTINSLYSSAYSVKVSDITINFGSSGAITMTITPASSSYYYKYDFYLKVYDSNNNQIISKRYYSTSGSSKLTQTYNISSNKFDIGTYNIKIINTYDNNVMSTSKLMITKINIESNNLNTKYQDTIEYKVRVSQDDSYKSGLNVIFNCNNKNYVVTTDDDGYAILKIHLKAGQYDITTKIGSVVNKNTIKINPVYVNDKYEDININSLTAQYLEKKYLEVKWKGYFEGYLCIYKGNKLIFKNSLDSSGYVGDYIQYEMHGKKLFYGFSVGTYNVKVVGLNGKILAQSTLKIVKTPTNVKISSIKCTSGAEKYVTATIYDRSNGLKHWNGFVKFKINGKSYKVELKRGIAKLKIKMPSKVKTYKCKATFLGDKNSKKSSKNFKIIVKKPPSKKKTHKKNTSKYKIITTTARSYWITKKSGKFTVKTKIWDMTAGYMASYKYIDTTLYKYGKQVLNTRYSVNYRINGRWTGWTKYGTVSTAHHRYGVYDSASVGLIKVKVRK